MAATMPSLPELTVRSVQTRAVRVPLTFALGTSAAVVRSVPLLLVDLQTDQGVDRAMLPVLLHTLGGPGGRRPPDRGGRTRCTVCRRIRKAWQPCLSRRYALLGVTGPVRMALSALDVAIWDALATAARLPLASLLGAERRRDPGL